jgi:hypothetical protein
VGGIVCLKCSEVLFEMEPRRSPAGKKTHSPRRCELEEEGDLTFYRCPRCGAKNIVIETRSPSGFPQLTVVACSMEK